MVPSSSSSSSKPPPNYYQMSLEDILNEHIDTSSVTQKRRQKNNEMNPQVSTEERVKTERKQKHQENQRLKLHIIKLRTFREELGARMSRLREFLSVELNWERMVKAMFEKVQEFERLLKPHFETGVREMLRSPETYGIIEEYHRQALESQKVEFQTSIVIEEEQVLMARREFNEYEKEMSQDWPIFCNLKRKAKLAEIRLDAYRFWMQVERTKLMAAKLKTARDWVKKEMWEKIVSQYISSIMQLQTTSSSPEVLQNVARAVLFFAPFSTGGQENPIQVAEVSSSTSSGNSRVVPMIVKALEQDPCDSTTDPCTSTSSGCSRTVPMIVKALKHRPCDSTSSESPLTSEAPIKIVKIEPKTEEKQWVPPKQFKMETSSVRIPEKKMMNFSIESILNLPPSEPTQKTPKIEPIFEPHQAEFNSQCSSSSRNNDHNAPELQCPSIPRKRPLTSSSSLAHDFKRSHLEPPAQYPPPLNDFYAQFNQFPLFYNMAPAPPQSVNNNWIPHMAQGYQGY